MWQFQKFSSKMVVQNLRTQISPIFEIIRAATIDHHYQINDDSTYPFFKRFFLSYWEFFFLLKINSSKLLCQKNVDLSAVQIRETLSKKDSVQFLLFISFVNLTNGVDDFDRIRRTQMSRVRYMVKTELKNRAKILISNIMIFFS